MMPMNMTAASRIQMIVDCDPGHDDAIALVLCHEYADVLAITTVSGNAPLEHTTRNALAVVELLERQTPVYSGAAEPLSPLLRCCERCCLHGRRLAA